LGERLFILIIGGFDHVYHIAALAPASGAETSKLKKQAT
jgi:hypothetical protein